ncbi:TPA: formylglycine-generating enzyme family protein [Candidatus Poribacteria bacterium]|nr:formylglycine-generating enzyme family protein [Candidatus Poribacteria bacterium]HIC16484.1 formylglycine-generating enzyme family protein [Candidatus Poribacteria bacterium]HIO81611.1 formylglycine-generating enzyme family protein [Candidatus Poribacteria bacterium]
MEKCRKLLANCCLIYLSTNTIKSGAEIPGNFLGFLIILIKHCSLYLYLMPKSTTLFMSLVFVALIGFIGCSQDNEEMRAIHWEEVTWKDGSKMLRIPFGSFEMGDQFNDGPIYEKPVHTVELSSFYIDVYEITNAQYSKFINEAGYKEPTFWEDPDFNAPDQPVVGVTWYDAMSYAIWAGKRLPTEAEWAYAARGGQIDKKFPWGSGKPDIPDVDGNYITSQYVGINGSADGYRYTAPVGSFPPNGYGLYDMAGNAREWCMDEYDDFYFLEISQKASLLKNPLSGYDHLIELITGEIGVDGFIVQSQERKKQENKNMLQPHVLRGGCWYFKWYGLRVALRNKQSPDKADNKIGFRCVRSYDPVEEIKWNVEPED